MSQADRIDRIFAPGQVAVVTGAALGIGQAMARRLAELGLRVVAVDVDEASLAWADGVANVEPRPVDVADAAAMADLARVVGPVAFLANNAATRIGKGFMAERAEWRRLMEVNLWGVIHGVDAFLPAMTDGVIVNTGSKQGITNPPGHPAYNMGKAALKSYTEGLAHELRSKGSEVTAHLLVPGFTTKGHDAPQPGAWAPEQVVERMLSGLRRGDFYLMCADNEVTPEMDRARILWGAEDITENRPALSRWHPDWADRAGRVCNG